MFAKFFSTQQKSNRSLDSVESLGAPLGSSSLGSSPLDRVAVTGATRSLSAAEEHRFRELVARQLALSRFPRAIVSAVLDGREPRALDMDSLRRRLVLALPREWEAIVGDHLASRLDEPSQPTSAAQQGGLAEFKRLAPYLAAVPRLLSSLPADTATAGGLVLRQDLPGLPTVLFVRSSSGLVPIRRRTFQRWGVRPSVAFRAALANLARARRLLTWTPRTLEDGSVAWVLATEDGLAPAQAYFLRHWPGALGRAGTLLLLDGEKSIVVAALSSPEKRAALAKLLRRAAAGTTAASGPALHWDGKAFTILPRV